MPSVMVLFRNQWNFVPYVSLCLAFALPYHECFFLWDDLIPHKSVICCNCWILFYSFSFIYIFNKDNSRKGSQFRFQLMNLSDNFPWKEFYHLLSLWIFLFEFCFIYFFLNLFQKNHSRYHILVLILYPSNLLRIVLPPPFSLIMENWIFRSDSILSMNFILRNFTVREFPFYIFFFLSQRFLNCIIRMLAVLLFDSSTTHNHFLNCGEGRRGGYEKNKKDRTHTWRLWNFHGGLEEEVP